MSTPEERRDVVPPWRTLVALWSVPAWYMAINVRAIAFINGTPFLWREMVPALAEWYLWVPLTPLVLRFAARYPLTSRPSWRTITVHLGAVVGVDALRGVTYAATSILIAHTAPNIPLPEFFWRIMVGFLPIAAAVYGALVAAGAAAAYARQARADALRAAQLESQLVRAELTALRANLQPHFLFNALHAVGALVRARDHDGAVRVIAELSDLLRALLRRDAPEEVPLADEIQFVERYLSIESVRFRDRLRVHWHVAPDTTDAIVPRLLLQPLAENAIRHGIGRSSTAGVVEIATTRRGDVLEITVTDDGPGPSESEHPGGLGLATARARLRHAYGSAAEVTLAKAETGGAVATVRLPFRRA